MATIQFLARAAAGGVSLDRVLTLGRQWLYVKPDEVQGVLTRSGVATAAQDATRIFEEAGGYCEPLLKHLGAAQIDSMDVSNYENATILQDLNRPWPESLREKFSVVIDAGTLEHVFNFPLALKNCLDAVAIGGHFITITPANNLLGHGFYQFSPELYFRVFTKDNGFSLETVLVYEQPWSSVWYEVADPEQVRSRVELANSKPTYMIVCARKVAAVEVFATPPVQSDYQFMYWKQTPGKGTAGEFVTGRPRSWKTHAPAWIGNLYRRLKPFRLPYFRKKRLT